MFNLFEKNGDYFYFIFRVLVGLLFLQHGSQKLFGVLEGNQAEIFTLFGLAGVIEFFGGLLIVLGLLTRWAALISALEMLSAYFMAHASKGFFPIINGGELALLYFASFLVILVYGAKKWGLDKYIFKEKP